MTTMRNRIETAISEVEVCERVQSNLGRETIQLLGVVAKAYLALLDHPVFHPGSRRVNLTDDMVLAAMAHVPGCDHDDMVNALEAALGLPISDTR
jgi:hypothetical protein